MHTLDGTTAGVVHVAEGSIPLEGDGGGARHAGLAGNALGSGVAGEVLSKDRAIVVLFFVLWRVDGEALCSMRHLLVRNRCRRYGLEGVNPTIAYTIAELFLLSPCDFLRQ